MEHHEGSTMTTFRRLILSAGILSVFTGMILGVVGCSTVTFRDKGISRLTSDPQYQVSNSFYLWGLIGEHQVSISDACQGMEPRQVQILDTPINSLWTVLTLGIYWPRTVRVWCAS